MQALAAKINATIEGATNTVMLPSETAGVGGALAGLSESLLGTTSPKPKTPEPKDADTPGSGAADDAQSPTGEDIQELFGAREGGSPGEGKEEEGTAIASPRSSSQMMSGFLRKKDEVVMGLWGEYFFVLEPQRRLIRYYRDEPASLTDARGGTEYSVTGYKTINERGGSSRKLLAPSAAEPGDSEGL